MVREGEERNGFIDPAVAPESFVVGVQEDPVLAVAGDPEGVIRDGMMRMKIENENEVVPFKYDGFI